MATATIDGKEYDLDTLSDAAKQQLASLQICDQKIRALQQEIGIVQTARNTFAAALNENLPKQD